MKTLRTSLVISLFLLAAGSARGQTIFVDANAAGANNGSSWENAYVYLQDALTAAVSGDQIWVAQGMYKPDHGAGVTIGDRNAEFGLKAGVAMYGGFPIGGGVWEQRDPNIYESVLSGDLNGNDEPNFLNNSENSYRICHIGWSTGSTVLDGFTIDAANANGPSPSPTSGAGLYNEGGGQMDVVNCKFLNNYAVSSGVAIRFRNPNDTGYNKFVGTLTGFEIINCLFQNNSGGRAIHMRGCSPIFRNCVFKQNSGAIYSSSFQAWPNNQVYSNPTFINVAFIGNSASSGGAMYIQGECTSLLVNCVFVANSSHYVDGGFDYGEGSAIFESGMSGEGKTTLLNCTITGNSAGWYTISNHIGTPTDLSNCIIWGNIAGTWGDLGSAERPFVLKSCCISDNDPNGTYIPPSSTITAYNCIDLNPKFIRDPNDGSDGWGVGDNDDFGNLRLSPGSPCIDDANNAAVPPDSNDIDNDGNTTEPLPWGLDGRPRFADGDCNSTDIVDMGAYEFTYAYFGDFDGQCDVDFVDFAILASQWLEPPGSPSADIAPEDLDGLVDELDLAVLIEHWLISFE